VIPKVGQLLRWYDDSVLVSACNDDTEINNDVGIVKEVQLEGVNFLDNDEYDYAVIIDWCKGPHSSYHDSEDYEESIASGEIVVV
jgi:hypothetical protein